MKENKVKMFPIVLSQTKDFFEQHFKRHNIGCSVVLDALPSIYISTMRDLREALYFDRNEAMLILDAMSGIMSPGSLLGTSLYQAVMVKMQLEDAGVRWGTDAPDLLERIGNLTRWESSCVELWCYGYWYTKDKKKHDDWIDILVN